MLFENYRWSLMRVGDQQLLSPQMQPEQLLEKNPMDSGNWIQLRYLNARHIANALNDTDHSLKVG